MWVFYIYDFRYILRIFNKWSLAQRTFKDVKTESKLKIKKDYFL